MSGTEIGAGDPETITVAYHPGPFVASLFVGVSRGFFAEAGLQVQLRPQPAGASAFGVGSTVCDVGYCNIPSLLQGRASGLPLRVVAGGAAWPRSPEACTLQVLVARRSAVASARDLEWKRVAVNSLGQISHLSLVVSARALGADPGRFRFVVVAWDRMPEALAAGEVEAADMGEPALTPAREAGARSVFPNSHGFAPEATHSVWVTSERCAQRRPEVVRRFRQIIERANDHCVRHPDDVRQAISTLTGASPALAGRLMLPHFSNRLVLDDIGVYLQAMSSMGLVAADLDLNELLLAR